MGVEKTHDLRSETINCNTITCYLAEAEIESGSSQLRYEAIIVSSGMAMQFHVVCFGSFSVYNGVSQLGQYRYTYRYNSSVGC